MEHTHITAWTDGAASGNPGPAGWAVLVNGQLASGWLPCATNNQAELLAVHEALLSHCPSSTRLTVITDSKLVVGWLTKRFRALQPTIEPLVVAILELAALKGVTLDFVRVKGHAGDENNDRVDRAARAMTKIARNALAARCAG